MKSWDLGFVLLPLLYLAILLTFPGVRCEKTQRQWEKTILDALLKDYYYDVRIRPNGIGGPDGPTVVHVNMYVRSISKINEADMEYSMQVTLRQQWTDDRLQYRDGKIRYLTLRDQDSIWKPDLFFSNEKEGHMHNLMMPNYLIRIFPNGQILYSVRLSLVLSCPMDLKNFPMDRQTCSIIMPTYGYTTEDLVFLWNEGDPVQVTKNLHLLSFTLNDSFTDYCTSRTNTGEYSCLKVGLVFERVFTYYLYQIYIPFCTLVILSWFTFWIDKNQVAVRISLGIAAVLAMSFLSREVSAPLPKTSYLKAIDVWSCVCHLFAIIALFEFALVSYFYRKSRQQTGDKESTIMDPVNFEVVEISKKSDFIMESQKSGKLNWRVWIPKLPKGPSRIDVLSRIFFPIAFAIFNGIYWSTY